MGASLTLNKTPEIQTEVVSETETETEVSPEKEEVLDIETIAVVQLPPEEETQARHSTSDEDKFFEGGKTSRSSSVSRFVIINNVL